MYNAYTSYTSTSKLTYYTYTTVVKPGRCPKPGPVGRDGTKGDRGNEGPSAPGCQNECSADDGCHGNEKCCSLASKCGRKCMKPEGMSTYACNPLDFHNLFYVICNICLFIQSVYYPIENFI